MEKGRLMFARLAIGLGLLLYLLRTTALTKFYAQVTLLLPESLMEMQRDLGLQSSNKFH